ncbi:hypothetical protein ACMDB5_10385 [Flavobacterium sp. W1B]|uniref:hypothetical protein n=1 Tax=Flavobacterium sp. W1B TaxID=3394146 RepID=UPI0039BCA19A
MISYDHSEEEFFDYFNRYCVGFILLANKMKSIKLEYQLANAFSNLSCRLKFEISIANLENLTTDEKVLVNKYFYNSQNSTGSGFVSFIYNSQRSDGTDFRKIHSFIQHYEFAKRTLNGMIKKLLPDDCIIEIEDLSGEPLFIYADRFLFDTEQKHYDRALDKRYEEQYKTSFEFDIYTHSKLLTSALNYSTHEFSHTISDKMLQQTGYRSTEEIRRYVLENNIPFEVPKYSTTINAINIDEESLLGSLQRNELPRYSELQKKIIIKTIEERQNERKAKNKFLNNLITKSGYKIGDVILILEDNWKKKIYEIGIIKDFDINYDNRLKIHYTQLKVNLEETKNSSKSVTQKEVTGILKSSKFEELKLQRVPKDKTELFFFLKKNI